MAGELLSAKAVGDRFKLRENGSAVEFVVLKHDYESGMNGKGRTLVRRINPVSDSLEWDRLIDSTTDLKWDGCDMKEWLENTYLKRFDSDVQTYIGTTKYTAYYPTHATPYQTIAGSVFLLSAAELGFEKNIIEHYGMYLTYDGSALDTSVGTGITASLDPSDMLWTRSVYPISQREDGEEMENSWHTRVYVWTKRTGSTWGLDCCEFKDTASPYAGKVIPCFTLPSDLVVDGEAEGSVTRNSPPTIQCVYQNGVELGGKNKAFQFIYTVDDPDGDALTVTEKIDGVTVKTFAPALGAQNVFSVGDVLFSAMEEGQYYELSIHVTDGYYTVSWAGRFIKSTTHGYKVYAGTIASKLADGSAVASGSYVWSERVCIYDPMLQQKEHIIFDPELTLSANESGSLEFTLPVENVFYDKINVRSTAVSVEEDGIVLWSGFVQEIHKNFDLEKEIYCTGELDYLNDISCKIAAKEYTAATLFRTIVGAASGWGIKSFRVGTISSEFESETVSTEDSGTQYTTVLGALNDILLANSGGYLRLRTRQDKTSKYGTGYTRYLDYLVDIDDQTDQTIAFGKNLLDLDYYISGQDIVNRIVVHGYSTGGWWFWKHTDPISVTVEDSDSIAKYGAVERCISVEGTSSTYDTLRTAGKKQLKELSNSLTAGFTINALDLKDAGLDVGRLSFMKKTRVISQPHKIDDLILCTKIVIPLDAPEEKSFTFGEEVKPISAQQAEDRSTAKRSLSLTKSVVSYISSTSSDTSSASE